MTTPVASLFLVALLLGADAPAPPPGKEEVRADGARFLVVPAGGRLSFSTVDTAQGRQVEVRAGGRTYVAPHFVLKTPAGYYEARIEGQGLCVSALASP